MHRILILTSWYCVQLQGYMPSKKDRRDTMLERKRREYVELLQQYYYIPDTDRGTREQTTLRQILVDIPRTNADVRLFQNERIHQVRDGADIDVSSLIICPITDVVHSVWNVFCIFGQSDIRLVDMCKASMIS